MTAFAVTENPAKLLFAAVERVVDIRLTAPVLDEKDNGLPWEVFKGGDSPSTRAAWGQALHGKSGIAVACGKLAVLLVAAFRGAA